MGFNDSGFQKRDNDEIYNDLNEKAKITFGNDINTDSHHLIGQINQIVADESSITEEIIEDFYKQTHVQTASGIHLDRLGYSYSRLTRLPATSSTTEVIIKGTPGYEVPVGTIFETDNGIEFETQDDVTLYQEEIENGAEEKVLEVDEDGNPIGTGYVNVISVDQSSEVNVPEKSINTVSEPVEEITDVYNPTKSNGGADLENDTDYRKRILSALDMQPGPPANGLINGVKNVAGVQQVKIVDNHTSATDQYGNPPHTVHIYSLGGSKENILQAIQKNIAFGIETVGSETGYVQDLSGDNHMYKFDYSNSLEAFIKVEINITDDWNSDSGVQSVKSVILDYLKTLEMGSTLHFSKLYQYVYQIKGINFATVTLGTDKEKLSMNDINPSVFEVVTSSESNIEVIINE